MGLMVLSLIICSVLEFRAKYVLAAVCLFWGAVGVIWSKITYKQTSHIIKDIDWYSIFFLTGIFVLVGTLTYSGVIVGFADWFITV